MARMTRAESRQITVERLRNAALKEIAENGYAATAIDRICETAGYSRGAFYANYNSKEELLLDLLRQQNRQEVENWIDVIQQAPGVDQAFAVLEQRFANFVGQAEWIMFYIEVQLYAKRNPEFSERFDEELDYIQLRVEKLIEALFDKVNKLPSAPLSQMADTVRILSVGSAIDVNHLKHGPVQAAQLLITYLRQMVELGKPRV